jgi:hypothetical protein
MKAEENAKSAIVHRVTRPFSRSAPLGDVRIVTSLCWAHPTHHRKHEYQGGGEERFVPPW